MVKRVSSIFMASILLFAEHYTLRGYISIEQRCMLRVLQIIRIVGAR